MLNNSILKLNKATLLAILVSCFGYYFFSYELVRADFNNLLISYTGLFLLFLYLIKKDLNWKTLATITVLFRVIFLLSTPNLSQDFHRFIWDGRILLNGFNPYLYLPEVFQNPNYTLPNQASDLVAGMGELNASHYSNYPPLNQLCFAIAALFSNKSIIGSIVVMRVLIILADIGVLYFGTKLLKALNLNPKAIFLYLLNPLIQIELTGNLHFEGIMVFFLIWSLYLLQVNKWKLAAIPLAGSIVLKLLPLLFLPLFFKQLKFKKQIVFYVIIGAIILLSFAPFLSENLLVNYSKTISLWFGQFEFNGSFHNIVKHVGLYFKEYYIVKILGKITPVLVILIVVYLAYKQQKENILSLITTMLFGLSFYLFTASTIHPWYVAMLLVLSIFTKYRYPLVWSFTIILSYSFYKNEQFINNYWLILIEYTLVFGFMIWEFIYKRNICLKE